MFRKVAMLSLMLFVVSVLSVYAQGQPGGQRLTPEERMAAQIKTLTEKLTLTADQVTKLKALYTKNNEETAKLREEGGGDREAMMAAMQKSRTELNKKIEALLDTKQKEAFAKYNKEQDEARAKRPRPPQQ